MSAADNANFVAAHTRTRAADRRGIGCARKDYIQCGDRTAVDGDNRSARRNSGGQFSQDLFDFFFFLPHEVAQAVVCLDDGGRLDKQRCTRCGRIVHDTFFRRLNGNDKASRALGDDRLLQMLLRRSRDDTVEHLAHLRLRTADRTADAQKRVRSIVGDHILGNDDAFDLVCQMALFQKRVKIHAECLLLLACSILLDGDRRTEQCRDSQQLICGQNRTLVTAFHRVRNAGSARKRRRAFVCE